MTPTVLREYTLKDLAQMAKNRGILGWHAMRKDDLIRALVRDAKQVSNKGRNASKRPGLASLGTTVSGKDERVRRGASESLSARPRAAAAKRVENERGAKGLPRPTAKEPSRRKATPPTVSRVAREIQRIQRNEERLKDLSGVSRATPSNGVSQATVAVRVDRKQPGAVMSTSVPVATPAVVDSRDRVVLMVRDAYWLHVHWELSSRSIQRAQAAMAEHWHTSKPVLRLLEVPVKGTTSSTEMFVRDIEIHGGVNNWYIDVVDPPKGYRVEIGYVAKNGRFHCIARSNSVVTPEPGMCDSLDQNWLDVAENCDKILALSSGFAPEGASEELQEVMEERLQRPVSLPSGSRMQAGADTLAAGPRARRFKFDIDAEMIIYGSTMADSHVTMGGEPVKVRDDGTFTIRLNLPDRRQVLPMTSCSRDGLTQQTIVLAIERNTKVMEPLVRDGNY